MKTYFLENTVTGETLETNCPTKAWSAFLKKQMPCELWKRGELLADKDWEWVEATEEYVLEETIHIDDREEVEV